MFLIILILLIYFLGFKKYYIKITDVNGASQETLIKTLKYEMGLSLTQIKEVVENTPYIFKIGSFLETFTLARKLRSKGLKCSIMCPLFKKPKEGSASPVVVPEASEGDNEQAWQYADEAYNLAMRPYGEDQVALAITSPEDAMRVDALLDKAEATADNPYEEGFWERITTLRDSVSWALKRHWTHSWMLILGVFMSIILLAYFNSDNQSDVTKAKQQLAHVEKWTECDTTLVNFPQEVDDYQMWNARMDNAKTYKLYMLTHTHMQYVSSKKSAAEYAQYADTASTEKRRELYLENKKECEEKAEEYLEQYNEWNATGFKDIKKAAIEECENEIEGEESDAFLVKFLLILAIIMTPLYIMASYQYGYVMVKYENEAAFLNKLRNWGYSIAAGLFGAGLLMNLLPDYVVTTHWSNGSVTKHTESDPTNIIIIVLKIALIIVALFVLCFTAYVIMAYSTATGLYRNYQWKKHFDTIKEQTQKYQK
ncbi:MAG: hypothetical protein IKU79_08440 [Bacteroidaceae bacterium]|jgi:hypothetical protein|nr:hypothetical protein [Bacteroidaceae bacterium]